MVGLLINGYLEGRDRSLSKGTDPTLAWGTDENHKNSVTPKTLEVKSVNYL
jgi:hypothetical protein